jgi:subtilase family serine protease
MRSSTVLWAVVVAGLVVASAVASAPGTPRAATAKTTARALVTDAIALPSGAPTAALNPSKSLAISLTLAYPDPAALAARITAIENPASPLYRAYLTHPQFESEFAPSASSAATVVSILDGAGARGVTVAPDRLSVSAQLTASAVDSLFGVRMVYAEGVDGGVLYTALGTPTLPAALSGIVSGVSGLSNSADLRLSLELRAGPVLAVPRSNGIDQFVANNSTGAPWFVGTDFAHAFGATQLLPGNSSIVNASYPTGVAIATLLASGYNASGASVVNTPPWDPAVVDAYFNATRAPGWPSSNLTGVPVNVGGILPPPPGPFGAVNDSSLDEFENSLDLEMAGSMAPGAPLYNFYFAGSLLYNAINNADVASYFDQDLESALSYNYTGTGARLGIISCSFGISDLNDTTWNAALQEAAVMGVTMVAASGDQGDAPNRLTGRSAGPWPVWPASAATNTTGSVSVGGVSLTLSGTPAGWFNGTLLNVSYDPSVGSPASLSTWWDTSRGPGTYAGSEGGISSVYPEPAWQFHSAAESNIVNATVLQGLGALGRAGPDIAFPANSTIAFVVADPSGSVYFSVLEGTSIAAPTFAGFLADEIAVAHHDFGFVAPEIYRMENYYSAHPGPANPFYDVLNGSNYVFSAGPGWDATTGWGTPNAVLFYEADANYAIRNYTYTGPSPTLPTAAPPPAVPWTEIFVIFGAGAVVAIALVLVMSRPPKNPNAPPPPSFGPMPPPAPNSFPPTAYAGPTFLCPYCGAIRPAEPVRCPRCGAL